MRISKGETHWERRRKGPEQRLDFVSLSWGPAGAESSLGLVMIMVLVAVFSVSLIWVWLCMFYTSLYKLLLLLFLPTVGLFIYLRKWIPSGLPRLHLDYPIGFLFSYHQEISHSLQNPKLNALSTFDVRKEKSGMFSPIPTFKYIWNYFCFFNTLLLLNDVLCEAILNILKMLFVKTTKILHILIQIHVFN